MALGNGIEQTLWAAADQLRANSRLKSWEYSVPVLGLIFLRYADHKFTHAEEEIKKKSKGKRRSIGKTDYQARGVLYMRDSARYSSLLNLPEGADIGRALNEAMKSIEEDITGFCQKALWLENHRVRMLGDVMDVADAYCDYMGMEKPSRRTPELLEQREEKVS